MKAAKVSALVFVAIAGLGAAASADPVAHPSLVLAQAEATGTAAPAAPDPAATAALWTKNCASCHGAGGKADTKTGEMLKVKDMTDPAVRAGFDRERMIKSTKEGVKKEGSDKLAMKPFGDKLSDAEIAALIDHVYAFGN